MSDDVGRAVNRQVDRVAQAEAEVQSALWDLQREIMCLDLLLSNADVAAARSAAGGAGPVVGSRPDGWGEGGGSGSGGA
ncbi:hypothetical protein [Phytoactinopolyspora limicola]|uniref:hypothetical protein n=1 Tax=Phytoactinopolyspora limicola TaxID=2715536 RepID=UPI0014098804|nr:hypothetical protein [Phytoactinopolyspora limicola]